MTRREWQIAVPILVGLLLCVAGFMHGVQIENSFGGISTMRAMPDGKLAVVANHALHVLDASGTRVARQPLSALGMTEDPNDMDWTVDARGRIEAWFFEDGVPRVVRCSWDDSKRELAQCAAAMSGPQLKANDRSRAVHLAVDRAGERVFIADAQGHRFQVFDLAGKRVGASNRDSVPLLYPNRLRFLGDDTLLVADNDHRRLVWVRVSPGQAPKLLRTLDAQAHPQARSNRTKVTDVALGPAGAMWMMAMKQGQKDGDVLVFDGDRPLVRAALPPGADPIVIESLGPHAVVGDYSLIKLYRLDAAGKYLGEFGDGAFAAEMAPLQALSRASSRWTTGSLIGGGVVILAGLLLAWRYSEKPSRGGKPQPRAGGTSPWAEPLRYPVVLEQTPQYRAAMRKHMWLLGLVLLLMLGMLVALGLIKTDLMSLPFYLQGGLGLLAMIGFTAWFVQDAFKPRELRVTAHRVGCFRGSVRLAESPLAEVFASQRALLIGRLQLPYQLASPELGKIPPMFDPELLDQALLARLPAANLVDDLAMGRLVIGRQRLWVKVVIAVAVLAAVGSTSWLLLGWG
jgi:hypothetical protein